MKFLVLLAFLGLSVSAFANQTEQKTVAPTDSSVEQNAPETMTEEGVIKHKKELNEDVQMYDESQTPATTEPVDANTEEETTQDY